MWQVASAASRIKAKAVELGFNLSGIARSGRPRHYAFYRSWLDKGYAGRMHYLETGAQKRGDPTQVLPGAKSVICCALAYASSSKPESVDSALGTVSNYAWGKDYHKIMLRMLEALAGFIRSEIAPGSQVKPYVDTGALLERDFAQEAGLGWIGKNTCLIHPGSGSFFFLGELLTDLELDYDEPFAYDHCGTCTRCMEACPTGALPAPRLLDATRCISYLTIEHRGPVAQESRSWIGNHLAGCDICQDVCPFNRDPVATHLDEFHPRPLLARNGPGAVSLKELAEMSPDVLEDRVLRDSPLKRLKVQGLKRNAFMAMGNSGDRRFVPVLKRLAGDVDDPVLADAIQWALAKLRASANPALR